MIPSPASRAPTTAPTRAATRRLTTSGRGRLVALPARLRNALAEPATERRRFGGDPRLPAGGPGGPSYLVARAVGEPVRRVPGVAGRVPGPPPQARAALGVDRREQQPAQ